MGSSPLTKDRTQGTPTPPSAALGVWSLNLWAPGKSRKGLHFLKKYLFFYLPAAAKSLQSCPTLQPYKQQPTRLPHPWDSPGKNTGVGCHFLPQCMKVKSESEVAQSCPTPSYPMDCSLLGSSVNGIFQARILEWGAIVFSTGS